MQLWNTSDSSVLSSAGVFGGPGVGQELLCAQRSADSWLSVLISNDAAAI